MQYTKQSIWSSDQLISEEERHRKLTVITQLRLRRGFPSKRNVASASRTLVKYEKYVADEEAKEVDIETLSVPPYHHCELNVIKMVWSRVKHYIKTNNTCFK